MWKILSVCNCFKWLFLFHAFRYCNENNMCASPPISLNRSLFLSFSFFHSQNLWARLSDACYLKGSAKCVWVCSRACWVNIMTRGALVHCARRLSICSPLLILSSTTTAAPHLLLTHFFFMLTAGGPILQGWAPHSFPFRTHRSFAFF